jgi:hypothetical protein
MLWKVFRVHDLPAEQAVATAINIVVWHLPLEFLCVLVNKVLGHPVAELNIPGRCELLQTAPQPVPLVFPIKETLPIFTASSVKDQDVTYAGLAFI